jgi:MFS family permease
MMTASLVALAAASLVLAALTALGSLTVWHVIAIAMVGGVATALYTPAMHTVVPTLVPPEHLLTAISLNSVQFNIARAIGPALAGVFYAAIGPHGCFALNAAAVLVFALVVARMHIPSRPAVAPPPILRALREGVGYVRRHPVIAPAIFLSTVMSIFGFPYIILLPAVAHGLGLDAQGLGYLTACVGAGAVVGGLAISWLGTGAGGPPTAVRGALAFGVVLASFGFASTVPQTMTVLFLLGALQTFTIASMTTTIQVAVHDGMRGRVMSMITVIFFGFSTLGGLIAGNIGDRVGVPAALGSGGVVTAAVAVLLARSRAFA